MSSEADELQRYDVRSLMEELVEAVLAVGPGLSEDDRSGKVADAAPRRG